MDAKARPTAETGDAVAATPVLDCDAAEREACQPCGVSRRVPAPSWPSRPHAHHSSPHPRAVQLLFLDQPIASALPLAQ
jgi:hypothetical protein